MFKSHDQLFNPLAVLLGFAEARNDLHVISTKYTNQMSKLTKKQKKHLHALAGIAYEKDLTRCIDKLFEKYQICKDRKITVWDMDQWIHEYHDEIACELYTAYTHHDPVYPVVFGIKSGVIKISDVEESCLGEIERVLGLLKKDK
jgi:hypothetical protein